MRVNASDGALIGLLCGIFCHPTKLVFLYFHNRILSPDRHLIANCSWRYLKILLFEQFTDSVCFIIAAGIAGAVAGRTGLTLGSVRRGVLFGAIAMACAATLKVAVNAFRNPGYVQSVLSSFTNWVDLTRLIGFEWGCPILIGMVLAAALAMLSPPDEQTVWRRRAELDLKRYNPHGNG